MPLFIILRERALRSRLPVRLVSMSRDVYVGTHQGAVEERRGHQPMLVYVGGAQRNESAEPSSNKEDREAPFRSGQHNAVRAVLMSASCRFLPRSAGPCLN